MPKIMYTDIKFTDDARKVVAMAEFIIHEYDEQGFTLTLRQLYYQFVARDAFPDSRRWRWTGTRWVRDPEGTKNADPNYKWLGGIISDARLTGIIDWDSIVDRTRSLKQRSRWSSPADIVDAAVNSYHIDMWENQPGRTELWVEKDALVGVISGVCDRYDVPYFACRGYTSQSEMWVASQRLLRHTADMQDVYILYLGDHDPSGIDMTRDVEDRLHLFMGDEYEQVHVDRIALNMDQVEKYNPPPNPAKLTDSRCSSYIDKFGDESWELDALSPKVMSDLIEEKILNIIDDKKWRERVTKLKSDKDILNKAATLVKKNINKGGRRAKTRHHK